MEDQIKNENQSYQEKYMENRVEISRNLAKHEQFEPMDYDDLQNFGESNASDSEVDNEEFASINPEFVDFNIESNSESSSVPQFSTSIVERTLLPNYQFYEMCSQLNDKQRKLFIFFIRYVAECRFQESIINLSQNRFTYF